MTFSSTENGRIQWRDILKSTAVVIKSHSLHFLALSIIFLYPIFFTLLVYPSFHLSFFHPHYKFIVFSQLQFFLIPPFEIIVLVVYTLFLSLFYLCAIATITYSSVQAFHDRPIDVFSSIKSIRNSFFPLLTTFLVSHTIFISIALVFYLILYISVQILHYDSNHFNFLLILVILPVLLWLQVNWSLAYAIAAVELKCGLETLRRSADLVKGMRWLAFWTRLFYGLVIGAMVIGSNVFLVSLGPSRSFSVTLSRSVQSTVLGSLGMNLFLVFNVVLYMYCKDLKGEKLPFEYECVSLEDEKKNYDVV